MNPAQQEANTNYTTLAAYYQGVVDYVGGVEGAALPYFPDIAGTFHYDTILSDFSQAARNQSSIPLGLRASHINWAAALLREASMRATGKQGYQQQQQYIGGNDANYYLYKAYSDVMQFGGPAS